MTDETLSPAVNRWTEQLVQCRTQLDKEAAAAEYSKSEPKEPPTEGETSE